MNNFDEEKYKEQLLKKHQPIINYINDKLGIIEKATHLSQSDVMKKKRIVKSLLEPHIENIKRISQQLGTMDTAKFKAEIDKSMYGNGWCVLIFQPLELIYEIVSYETEHIEISDLYLKLQEAFDDTNYTIEEKLKSILGDADSTFIHKQFTLMRLNYRVNSIPSIIMLIEKLIIKITGNEGKFINTGKVPRILETHIDSLVIEEENKEATKDIYIEGFKNNINIVNKTFVRYEGNEEAVQEMNILNRNQIFHGLIDFDSIDEIHFYKLYFILIFLTEVYEYEHVE